MNVRFAGDTNAIRISKGGFQSVFSDAFVRQAGLEIKSSSHCFGRFVQLELSMIGRRVRFFGTDKSVGPSTGPGYVAFEVVP
jgi:hypothetical protein